jgi:DNA-binding NtrC family response regulator
MAAKEALMDYDWPGNVRELQNRIQRASLVARSDELAPEDLGLDEQFGAEGAHPESELPASMKDQEALEIQDALGRAQGVISRAAAELGVSRQALYRRMARLGISVERRMTAR